MNETERMLLKAIIKAEEEISQCMKTERGMKTNYMKMLRHKVKYYTECLIEGRKPKHPIE